MLKDALLENRKSSPFEKSNFYFSHPLAEIVAYDPAELNSCFQSLKKWQEANYYLVGYFAYEAGLFLQPKLNFDPKKTETPLLHFIVYRNCERLTATEVDNWLSMQFPSQAEHFIYNARLFDEFLVYRTQLNKIANYLKNGDTYQVNFTGKYHFDFQGEPLQFYKLLRQQQRVEYSAYLNFGPYQILSMSPELFFKKTHDDLVTKPMKGTAARLQDITQDLMQKHWLRQDEKNRAENLMIVDLMRNDLNRIATEVNVEKLFAIESFETLHQMISLIRAKVPIDLSLQSIMAHLLPCGSITGAPKIRTLEIINELEREARGIYTGALGYVLPNNDMCFNVAIRTLVLHEGRGEVGVGSGIVVDSEPEAEWQEVQTKLKFISQLEPGFNLIESFLYENGHYRYLTSHLNRMESSAQWFNFNYNQAEILNQLMLFKQELTQDGAYKIRLLLYKHGKFELTWQKLEMSQGKKVIVASERIDSAQLLLRHKTTAASVRGFYDACFKKYKEKNNYFDVLFINEKNELTEGTRSNIFIEKNGQFYTPPITAGLLPGIMRQHIIHEKKAIQQSLTLQSLYQADNIWLTNSVRGMVKVELDSTKIAV